MKKAIIVIGYNRKNSIERLMQSVEKANYGEDTIDLIFSIDNSGETFVEEYTKEYEWKHGRKIVRTFNERQGLKKHVLSCGDYFSEYDWLIILEDDLIVSPNFFQYAKQAVDVYSNDDRIAGISLYSHRRNVLANRTFMPRDSRYDVFFMQFAQSWGQVWMKNAWQKFMTWYAEHAEVPLEADDFPKQISNWSKSSWLKYHIKYCVETNRFFAYPYRSLSTCYAEIGEHQQYVSTVFQVPLEYDVRTKYELCTLDESQVKYDVYFEPISLPLPEKTCIDIYGKKKLLYLNSGKFRYCLTCKPLNLPIKSSYGLNMVPHEQNVIDRVMGKDIFLYEIGDRHAELKNESIGSFIHRMEYYQKLDCTIKEVIGLLWIKIKKTLKLRCGGM